MGRGAAGTADPQPSHKALAQAKLDRAERRNHAVPVAHLDMNGDGIAETVGFDTNGDGKIDAFDTDGDGKIDKFLSLDDPLAEEKATHTADHRWQAARDSTHNSGEGVVSKRTFGLLSGMKRREDRDEERRAQLEEAEGEAGFASSLFDGAKHRIKMVDDIYMHMLDDQSAAIVLQHAAALQQSLGQVMRDLQKKTQVTKSARSIASMYPDDPARERAKKQKQQALGAATAAAVASVPDVGGGAPAAAAAPRGQEPSDEDVAAEVQAPRPPSSKRQGGPVRRQAAPAPAPAVRPESSERGSVAGSENALAATMSDRDLVEADRAREKERAKLKDERNKALQATVKEKQAAIGDQKEANRELQKQIQALNSKLQKKDGQLRSIQELHRETENELLDRVDHLEAQLSSVRHSAPMEDAMVVSGGDQAMNLNAELQGALSRLMSTQEALQHRDADLTNSKKKIKVLKDKVSLLERKAVDLEAAQEESAEETKNIQAKLSRSENKLRVSDARARKTEEEAAAKAQEALELNVMVDQANDELKGRDEQGASLAAKLQKAVDAVGQKADEMERLKALLAVAHAENEKAIELEQQVAKERRKALKCKKDAERADAKLAASNAKLAKRMLEIDELKSDVADAENRVAGADAKVAQSKADMLTKDSVVDKASADTAERLKALRDCEQEIRDLHAALDRHDAELEDRDAKVTEAEEAVTAAWKFAKKGIADVKVDAANKIATVQATAAREVQKIKSDNVADEMLQASFVAVKAADTEAQTVRAELKRSVDEAEKHRNTSVALLAHLEVSRVEREQLTMQVRHCQDMLSKMFASVTEAAALKAELELSQSTVRAFRMRHAVSITRMEGLEEQVRVLRDEDQKDEAEHVVDDDASKAKRAIEIAAATEVVDGNRTRLIEKVREWMLLEVDVDKIKGQKNKALEKAREADERAGHLQREMIRSVGHAALDKITSDIEISEAKVAQIEAEEAQTRAQALTDELNAETSQILEMLDAEKAGRSRLEENLQHQIADRELLMASMQRTDQQMHGVQGELEDREEVLSTLRMELEETQTLVRASHARESAHLKALTDVRSVRVVDYIMSRPDLCPVALVTGHTNATGHRGGAAAAHAMVGAVKEATAAYDVLMAWRSEKWHSSAFSVAHTDEQEQWAPQFGVSPLEESGLLWAVEEALAAPVAAPWTEKIREVEGQLLEERLYYVHSDTGVEVQVHPLKDHYLALLGALREVEGSMTASYEKMRNGLGATPPVELVQEAWQVWVEDCVTELFRHAVKRHAIIKEHYTHIAKLIKGDPDAAMSQLLRSKRPGAKGKKKKKVSTDPASKAGVMSVEWKAKADADALQTVMRTESELGAAVELVGASPANMALLRVRSLGSLAKCGNMMLGGGQLLDHEASEPRVQWFRTKHGIVTRAGQSGVNPEDFEPVPRARSLSYTPSALDAGRLLRLVVWPGEGHQSGTVWAPAGDMPVEPDEKVATNARARIASGVVRANLKSARTGDERTILVQRGESSRAEVRDGAGRALLEIHMGMVVFDQSYDFPDSVSLLHVETDLPLKELLPDAGEVEEGMTAKQGPPVVLQARSADERDELLLALRGLQQHDGTMEVPEEDEQ